jgi:hypothetical protein
LGIDWFLDNASPPARVTLTFGNAIFASAVLTMTIPLSLGLASALRGKFLVIIGGVGIVAAGSDEGIMVAGLDDLPVFQNDKEIRVTDSRKPVGHNDHRSLSVHLADRLLNRRLGSSIQITRGLVKQ